MAGNDHPESSLSATAKAIPLTHRARVIAELPEAPDLHQALKRLLERRLPGALVEVTHGADEYGKDLVVVQRDGLGERVVAFVVKSGNITGKTAGVVDNILSQVNQATRHAAKLKAVIEDKKVTQVFVVVAGRMSSNARSRIQNEVRGVVQDIWDLDRLTDDFTNYYPEIFFDALALDFLQRRIIELESAHPLFLKFGENRTLSEWFVDPIVAAIDPVDNMARERRAVARRKYTFVKLKDELSRSKRLLLVGAPGSGKSAVIAKLAIDMMSDALTSATAARTHDPIDVPVFMPAQDLLKYDDVDALLRAQFAGDETATRFKLSVLLIDGLDEVGVEHREEVAEKAVRFSRELGCSLVVTTRWIEALSEAVRDLRRVELLEFKFNQAMKLFEKLVSNDAALLKSLRAGLDAIQGRLQLSPLSLVLLVEVVREYREVPSSVTELYDRFFDYALGRQDRDKGIEALFGYQIKRAFLGELAYSCFFERNEIEIDRSVFDDFATAFAVRQGYDASKLPEFLAEIERANVLKIADCVQFAHRSFLDYFVATRIQRSHVDPESLCSLLVESYFSPLWSDVTFFVVGIDRIISREVISAILAHNGGDDLRVQVQKLASGRLLQAGWLSPIDVKVGGVNGAITFAQPLRDAIAKEFEGEEGLLSFSALGDVVISVLGSMSFGSSWLVEANTRVLDGLLDEPGEGDMMKALPLISALKNRIPDDQFDAIVTKASAAATRLGANVQGRVLAALMVSSTDRKEIQKGLLRRFERLVKRYPSVRKGLFPDRKKRLTR